MFAAILAAAPKIGAAASAAGSIGNLFGGATNKNDQIRANRAAAYLEHALAGDVTPARIILGQKDSSATAYGKQIYAQAWQQIQQQRPDIASKALQLGPAGEPNTVGSGQKVAYETTRPTNSTASPLVQEYQAWQQQVNAVTANTVQRIGAGASSEVANQVQGENNPYRDSAITIPTNYTTLAVVGVVIAGLAIMALKK